MIQLSTLLVMNKRLIKMFEGRSGKETQAPPFAPPSPLLVDIAKLARNGVERRPDGNGLRDDAKVQQIIGGDGFVGGCC